MLIKIKWYTISDSTSHSLLLKHFLMKVLAHIALRPPAHAPNRPNIPFCFSSTVSVFLCVYGIRVLAKFIEKASSTQFKKQGVLIKSQKNPF